MGEANMDGSIYISDMIEPDSAQERETVAHEMRHATDIKIGKLEYGDYHVKWNGETFPRETIDGIDSIYIEGEWKQTGNNEFPWEEVTNNNKNNNK